MPQTGIYDADEVSTGQPVFRRLASQVNLAFDYAFGSLSTNEVNGVHRLTAVVTDTNGWRRTFSLTEQAPFEGNTFTVRGNLDLNQIQALIDTLESETGVKRDHYEVSVVPEVLATGVVGGQAFSERFAPRLGFRFDSIQLQMLPPGPREADPRRPSQPGALELTQIEPNSLPILSWKLAVSDARRLALLGLGLCLAAAAAFGFYLLRGVGGDEPSRIEARLGAMLVSVRSDVAHGERVIDVESIDDLAKLAERAGVMVLHEARGTAHLYFVQDGPSTYRYQAFGRRVEAGAAAAPVAE